MRWILGNRSWVLGFFLGKMPYGVLPLCDDRRMPVSSLLLSSFVRSEAVAYISGTVWPRITKFYRHIHADLSYICTGYDVTNYFRSEATVDKTVEMPHQTALDRILVARRFASPPIGGLLVRICTHFVMDGDSYDDSDMLAVCYLI